MKRILIITILSMLLSSLSAAVLYNNSSDYLDITVINDNELSLAGDDLYQTIAFPATDVTLQVLESETILFDNAGNEQERQTQPASERVVLEATEIMREMILHTIRIKINEDNAGTRSVINSVTFRLQANSEIRHFAGVSTAFLPIYEKMADNYQTSYLRNLTELPPKMLIVAHEGLANLSYFTDWKNERGIATEVVMFSDLGTTPAAIKNYILELHNTEENPPDFLLLIGDVDGDFTIPSYYIASGTDNNVTDHPYTLLEGEDYLPEMIVGRMSIDSQEDFNTIISKVLYYEKTPIMDDSDWFDNILLAAGNFADTSPIPTTPVTTMMWLAEKVEEYGYDDITEVYFWPDAGYTNYPGTGDVMNAIDAGVGIVAYRGWGNAYGWGYPYFHTENILNLSNGFYLPVMTSIVCNTGDFANVNVDPCFGELWLTAGNSQTPKGGVAFVGPSDLHTKTQYNNAIFAGFYHGLLDEGIHTFGSAVLRGKLELYQNYPREHATGSDVEFYYYVYNILGDPTLSMWTRTPESMTCELPSEIGIGQNYLDIYVPEISEGMVTAHKEGEFLVSEFIEGHHATLYFSPESQGEITVTITAVNHLPLITEVDVEINSVEPAITQVAAQEDLIAGEEVPLEITLANMGTESAGFTAHLTELSGMATVVEESVSFGEIAGGADATASFTLNIDSFCPEGSELSLQMTFEGMDNEIKFPLSVSNLLFMVSGIEVNDSNGVLEPGETAQITVSLENIGAVGAQGLTASILPATTALTADIDSADLGAIAPGASAEAIFEISAASGSVVGRQAGVYLHLEDDNGRAYDTIMMLTIGVVDNTAPTGPSLDGYYAYDNFDVDYEAAPDYFWEEIDPAEGGSGEVILMEDDQANTIALPFEFTYYGTVYDSITVSSNGWISFETTWQNYFRNWLIPAALGPRSMIAAYWDDLLGPNGGVEDLRLCYYYNEVEDYFVIEWNDAINRQDYISQELFQIILYPSDNGNGEIQINYNTVNNPDTDGNYCTMGIQNADHTDGILYSFSNFYPASATPLQNGLAIKYSTQAPDSFTGNDGGDLLAEIPQLNNNYPNPFNPETTFSFNLPRDAAVELSVYNIKGELVKTIVKETLPMGDHSYIWTGDDDQGRSVASGVYFYQLKDNRLSTTKKCVLMK